MAKKRVEPFNPWPSFVDLFASVIMVVLMFMLILIVNITYYAQFKYKISYTGTVNIDSTQIKPTEASDRNLESQEYFKEDKQSIKSTQEIAIVKDNVKKELEAVAGMDLSITDNNLTRQENVISENSITIRYLKNEVILDPKSMKEIEKFLLDLKAKNLQHTLWIYVKEPQNQISASVGKQIALSRVLNMRNLFRSKGYTDKDIIIKFRDKIPEENLIEHESGYVLVTVKRKN